MQYSSAWQRYPGRIAATVILASTIVRLWFVASGQLDLVQDESQYWDWSRNLQMSYYSKGPLIAWIIHFWTSIFGDTELGVRIGAIVHSLLAQSILYVGVAHIMRKPSVGMWTIIIANTTPLFMASSILMTTDSPLLVCWSLALFALYRASEREDAVLPYVTLAVSVAVGILAKYLMVAMVGVALLYMAGLHRHNMLSLRFTRRTLFALALGTVAGFTPIVLWNMQHDWVSFRHVGALAGFSSQPQQFFRLDRSLEYLGAQIGLITPWWFIFMLAGAWRAMALWRGSAAYALRADMTEVRQSMLLACGFWMLWGAFLLWSLHSRIYANWSAMSYVAGIILAATAVDRGSLLLRRAAVAAPRRRFSFRALCVGLGIVTFVLVHGATYLPLPERLNPSVRLMGWHDLGRKLSRLQQTLPDPDRVFFFSASYDMTASLAFYAPGQPIAYCADFGRRMSQYDLWPGPQGKTGWDAVYVGKDARPVPQQLYEMFASVESQAYRTDHHGRPGRTFTIAVLRHFNGNWPQRDFSRF